MGLTTRAREVDVDINMGKSLPSKECERRKASDGKDTKQPGLADRQGHPDICGEGRREKSPGRIWENFSEEEKSDSDKQL